MKCTVVHGGILSSRKGLNLPSTDISLPSLTDKDREDLPFALSLGVDWVGLSFVRTAADVVDLKRAHRRRQEAMPGWWPRLRSPKRWTIWKALSKPPMPL